MLGQAANTFSDDEHWLAYDESLVEQMRKDYAEGAGEDAAGWRPAYLRRWLAIVQGVHPGRLDELVERMIPQREADADSSMKDVDLYEPDLPPDLLTAPPAAPVTPKEEPTAPSAALCRGECVPRFVWAACGGPAAQATRPADWSRGKKTSPSPATPFGQTAVALCRHGRPGQGHGYVASASQKGAPKTTGRFRLAVDCGLGDRHGLAPGVDLHRRYSPQRLSIHAVRAPGFGNRFSNRAATFG